MTTTRTRKALVALAVIGALGVGVVIPATAQDADGGDAIAAETRERTTERDRTHAEHRTALAEALAGELDLDVDRVAAALDAVREEHRAEHAEHRAERADRRAEHAERRAERQGEAGERQHLGPAAGQPGHRGGADPRGPAAGTQDAA